ncbi:hypothetical protein Barb6_02479 [Bacteroidales bacterium Barb6]|nr:hypothetical protein Barb6_02479 [Bacteroidales bacterium Barb6]
MKKSYADAPKGQEISAPHGAQRNAGFTNGTGKGVLKERPNITCIYVASFFQNSLVALSINPTFRYAACGAEIRYPFRIPLAVSSLQLHTLLSKKALHLIDKLHPYPVAQCLSGKHGDGYYPHISAQKAEGDRDKVAHARQKDEEGYP